MKANGKIRLSKQQAQAFVTAFIILFIFYCQQLYVNLTKEYSILEAATKSALAVGSTIITITGLIVFAFAVPFTVISYGWHHILPTVATFVTLTYCTYRFVPRRWRNLSLAALLFAWLVYGMYCASLYVAS